MEYFPDNITAISSPNFTNSVVFGPASYVTAWIALSIGLPLILLAIYALYFLVQADHIAPVYVINLLISDLIQIGSMPVLVAGHKYRDSDAYLIVLLIYYFGLMASVGFMVCTALERYLVIAFPLWYRFRRNIKLSLVVSSIVWAFPFFQLLLFILSPSMDDSLIILAVLLLLPFPLLIFFLVGTLRALSHSISVPLMEKRRIVGTLVLVLTNYAVLFLPLIVQYLASGLTGRYEVELGSILVQFSPLVDLVLYVFMRRGAKETLLAFPCLDRSTDESDQSQVNTVTDTTGVDSSV